MWDAGFAPNEIVLPEDRMAQLLEQIERDGLWDDRFEQPAQKNLLLLSQWGFRYLTEPADFDSLLEIPFMEIGIEINNAAES
jgi:hypothetical protein